MFIAGEGNSAGQAAMFFSNYAASVTLLIRGESITNGMSDYVVDQIGASGNVRIELFSEVDGTLRLDSIVVLRNRTGGRAVCHADAQSVMIGAQA